MSKELDIESILGSSSKEQKGERNSQNKQKAERPDSSAIRGVARASKMRDTFRIPFVYRVKKRVLNALLVLPGFAIYMMIAHHYGWDMGTKTYLLALFSFMCYGGSYFFVSMIDPEDWQAVEKAQKSRDITNI